MPFLQEVYEEWSAEGLVLLAINIGESPETAEKFMQDNNLTFPVLVDANKVVMRRYSVVGIPSTFFVGKDGLIKEKMIGAFPDKELLEKRLSKILFFSRLSLLAFTVSTK